MLLRFALRHSIPRAPFGDARPSAKTTTTFHRLLCCGSLDVISLGDILARARYNGVNVHQGGHPQADAGGGVSCEEAQCFITRKSLLKLLYIADRELLQATHRPLTGDRPVAMDHGPVLTHTYDLLKGTATGIDIWNTYIQQVAPYTHRLVADPGVGRLSKVELAKLEEVVDRYWQTDDDDLPSLDGSAISRQREA